MELVPNIRHLAALAATVRHGSLTCAARAVNLTQPALTQAIASLERAFGCSFFDRGPAGMTPTEPARLLAPRAERAIALIGSPRVTGTQVRAFVAVARAGSLTGASAELGLSPASLHRAVSDLSLTLGQRLTERRGRQLLLTQSGRRRLRAFGVALAELRSGYDEVARWRGLAAGRIVVGAMPLSRARWLPAVLLRFAGIMPGVDVRVVEGSHAELSSALRDGELDIMLGALREGAAVDDLDQLAIFSDYPKIILRRDHPLATSHTSDASALATYPWIMPATGTPLRDYWETMLRGAGVEPPHIAIECGSVLTTRQLLLGSDAVTLLSPDQLAVEIDAGLLVSRAPPSQIRRRIGISVRAGWRPTDPQAQFMALLGEEGLNYNS